MHTRVHGFWLIESCDKDTERQLSPFSFLNNLIGVQSHPSAGEGLHINVKNKTI